MKSLFQEYFHYHESGNKKLKLLVHRQTGITSLRNI